MTTRKPAPSLKLSDATIERPTVEFLIRSYVDLPNEEGVLESTEQTSIELFQVKLETELTLEDHEELTRLIAELQEVQEVHDDDGTPNLTEMTRLRFCYRRLIGIAFYDHVPDEAIGGLTLQRLEEITDFLSSVWPGNRGREIPSAEQVEASTT